MNKVYIVVGEYSNGFDSWEHINSVFNTLGCAEDKCGELIDKNDDPYMNYFWVEWDVKNEI